MVHRFCSSAVFAGLLALTLAACGGGSSSSSTSTSPTPPSAPYSATDLVVGGGATATQGRSVTVSYNGWLYDPNQPDNKGTRFDSNPGFTFVLGVGSVIRGWDMGVVGMKVGGTRRLTIPPELGYGPVANGPIPANSTLVFDILLVNVN